jgi:hypothetical protein
MRSVALLGLFAWITGCSSFPVPQSLAGLPLEQLRGTLGSPTYEVKLGNGNTRRFFTDRNSLVRTWRADFDPKDHLVELVPATTSAEFAELTRGTWKKPDVQALFGLPYRAETFGESGRTSFYYLHKQYSVRWAYVVLGFDGQGVLDKVDVQRIDAPASARGRPDVP